MSDMRVSPSARALLSAAKADAPSARSRANVWAGISGTVGAVAGAGSVASAAGGTSAKMLILGTLLGGTATVGMALALLRFEPAPPRQGVEAPMATIVRAARPAPPSLLGPSSLPGLAGSPGSSAVDSPAPRAAAFRPAPATLAPTHSCLRSSRHQATDSVDDDSLAHEASLVADARGALAHGDAKLALESIRAARALPSRQLAPEELAVEAQALRWLGRSAEAKDVGDLLKTKFPESALAR